MWGYRIKEFLNYLFIKLKLLSFLDLSWTEIIKLPYSVCGLYNLETFFLSSCYYIKDIQPLHMEGLINLWHLNIRNICWFKVPLHPTKFKSLQVLVGSKFLLCGLRMDDLDEAQNLYGYVLVVELQNVVDWRQIVKENMREKDHVDKLSLEYIEIVVLKFTTEREILDEQRPHKNLKEVEITRYWGTSFTNWLADPLFLKLVKLSLIYCKDCYSLQILGQLPFLKFLLTRRMHGIREMT